MVFFHPHHSNGLTDFPLRWARHGWLEWTEMQGISPPKETSFWWSSILVTGITRTSLCVCKSLSIPVVSTDLSVPPGVVLMPLKNSQNQWDPWSARSSGGCSPSVFASGVYNQLWRGVLYFCVPSRVLGLATSTHYPGYFFFSSVLLPFSPK